MYSSSELCGNADLLRRIIQYAADGHNDIGVEETAGQDLNPQPTVAFGQGSQIGAGQHAMDFFSKGNQSFQVTEGGGSHSLFVQPGRNSHWADTYFARRESETSSAPTVHQPVACRPRAQQYSKGLHFQETGYPQFKLPAAHPVLADLTNKEHALGFPDPDAEDRSEDDEIEALHGSCSHFGLDAGPAFRSERQYDSDPAAGYFSEPGSTDDLERLRTLGSQDSTWTVLLPRQRRRKSERPARAPEAVGPEWYAEQRLAKRMAASLLPLSSSEPMQLRRARSRAGNRPDFPPADRAASAGAAPSVAGPSLDSKASSRECEDCGTTQTPLWRQYEDGTYCNACGLRRKRADGAYVRSSKASRC